MRRVKGPKLAAEVRTQKNFRTLSIMKQWIAPLKLINLEPVLLLSAANVVTHFSLQRGEKVSSSLMGSFVLIAEHKKVNLKSGQAVKLKASAWPHWSRSCSKEKAGPTVWPGLRLRIGGWRRRSADGLSGLRISHRRFKSDIANSKL